MSESKAKLEQQLKHLSRIAREASYLIEIMDDAEGEIEDRYFHGLRAALKGELASGSSTSTSQATAADDMRQTLTENEIECLWHEACLKHLDLDDSAIPEFARAVESKVAARCRAEGGDTSKKRWRRI